MTRSLGALALFLVTLVTAGCASTGGVPRPQPFPMPRSADSGRPPRLQGVVGTALALRGVGYRNGGADPSGFDCSGFTQYVFGRHGLELPREVRDQYRFGKAVRRDKRAPGDLLFFSTVAAGASHVGIAIGGDEFVHAPSSTGVVRVERLSSSYWSRRFVGARRVTPP